MPRSKNFFDIQLPVVDGETNLQPLQAQPAQPQPLPQPQHNGLFNFFDLVHLGLGPAPNGGEDNHYQLG